MDRGPRVPDKVRLQIASTYLELRKKNPKIKAPAVREAVRPKLKNVPYPGWPGLSVVQKVITAIRKKDADPLFSRQDEPWCLGCLRDNPITPDALKAVCEIWASRLNDLIAYTIGENFREIIPEYNNPLDDRSQTNLSIREVKWIVQLYCIIKEDTDGKPLDVKGRLYSTAELYAMAERLHDILGIPFESDEMDRHLILGIPKLLKVNRTSAYLDMLRYNLESLSGNPEIPISCAPLLIDDKVPEWLIPLVAYGGEEKALEIMRKQKHIKIQARAKSTKKEGKE